VNRFQAEGLDATPVFQIRPEVEAAQLERLRAVRAQRDATAWKESIERLKQAAIDGGNLMPRIVDAARALATVGEISDTLRSVFGEYRESAS